MTSSTIPELPGDDAETSFPYTPVNQAAKRASRCRPGSPHSFVLSQHRVQFPSLPVKTPSTATFSAWTILFTEQLEVVDGTASTSTRAGSPTRIDGFRIDTVKHVNIEFWEKFAGAILDYAESVGKDEFYIFGEVYSGNEQLLSYYTTRTDMGRPCLTSAFRRTCVSTSPKWQRTTSVVSSVMTTISPTQQQRLHPATSRQPRHGTFRLLPERRQRRWSE